MARRTRRKYYKRRTRWAANIKEVSTEISTTQGTWAGTLTLSTNPAQSTLGVSQIYTVKNFMIDFTIESANHTQIEGVTFYIMYVPQGMNVTESFNLEHPEYILNYKYLGSPTSGDQTGSSSIENQQFQPIRMRSRLSRKLNTGDSIILFMKGISETSNTAVLKIQGLLRWWTKAN